MTLLWFVSGASLAVAIVALAHARRNAKNLERLSQHYWELKYQNGELRARLDEVAGPTPPSQQTTDAAPARGRDSFVPISSLKR